MVHTTSFAAALVSTLLLGTQALGINCRGSALCSSFLNGAVTGNEVETLAQWIQGVEKDGVKTQGVDVNRFYKNGEQIACYERSHICVFLQNTNGAQGSKIKELAKYVDDHGCKTCGSVPTDYPNSNNVKNGELTFNYVTKSCGNGLC
ncbi:killer toxin [Whalleya microplaca]|nr:killer toxin [Whalleya microplaca]